MSSQLHSTLFLTVASSVPHIDACSSTGVEFPSRGTLADEASISVLALTVNTNTFVLTLVDVHTVLAHPFLSRWTAQGGIFGALEALVSPVLSDSAVAALRHGGVWSKFLAALTEGFGGVASLLCGRVSAEITVEHRSCWTFASVASL